jgi:hypothetical protein
MAKNGHYTELVKRQIHPTKPIETIIEKEKIVEKEKLVEIIVEKDRIIEKSIGKSHQNDYESL